MAVVYVIVQSLGFYRRKRSAPDSNYGNLTKDGEIAAQLSHSARQEAQAALLEYLHSTRSLQFTDAEFMIIRPNFSKSC
ncbi:hypothetical protein U1Q18_007128 [Sarracenia purpurea var. burkii]